MSLPRKSGTYNPLGLSFIFLFGMVVGMLTENHSGSITRNAMVVLIATVAFHFSHANNTTVIKWYEALKTKLNKVL